MGKVAVRVAVVCGVAVAVTAAVVVHRRMKKSGKWEKAMEIVKEFEEKCATPISKLRQVADAMLVEMHAGLASEGGSKLKMLISYVDNLPTGYFNFFPSFININAYVFTAVDLIQISDVFSLMSNKTCIKYLCSFIYCFYISVCVYIHTPEYFASAKLSLRWNFVESVNMRLFEIGGPNSCWSLYIYAHLEISSI